jgi:hypothetical protein
VQVHVQTGRTAETLDQGDHSGAGTGADSESCPAGEIGLDGADDDCKTAPERVRPAGEQQTQWPRETQDPLSHWHFWKDMVDQMSGSLDHPPRAAGRAEPAAFAGKGDEVFMAARGARSAGNPREP